MTTSVSQLRIMDWAFLNQNKDMFLKNSIVGELALKKTLQAWDSDWLMSACLLKHTGVIYAWKVS